MQKHLFHQMASPNTETMQYIVLFSHLTVHEPSVELSQKQELAVCSPAPFFCIMTQVTIYLNGFWSFVKDARQDSTTLFVHWLTLAWAYELPPMHASIDSLMMLDTSSTTNWVSSVVSSAIPQFLRNSNLPCSWFVEATKVMQKALTLFGLVYPFSKR